MYEGAVGSAGLWAFALNQGTTLVVPLPTCPFAHQRQRFGLQPLRSSLLPARGPMRSLQNWPVQGLKAQISLHLLWPD